MADKEQKKMKVEDPKESIQYLQVTCPAQNCKRPITLVCPYCLTGALHCDPAQYVITCTHCDNQMKAINCTCGFTIKPSYICRKQQKLKKLQKNTDFNNYKAIAFTLTLFTLFVWVFSTL